MSEAGANHAGMGTAPAWQRTVPIVVPLEQAAIDALNIEYSGIAIDSRKVKPGDLFIAYAGELTDGRAYIPQALLAGAVAVLWDASEFTWNPDWKVPNLPIANLRYQVGHIADSFFGHPSRQLWIAGITGTNGKTSCARWIAQSLTKLGSQCAVIGTLGSGLVDDSASTQTPVNTTPDAVSLQATLADMKLHGANAAAMEVSSHGIEQGRVNGVAFDVALFTNLTRDHLDYHGSIDAYKKTKERLFSWPLLKHAVINLDDRFGAELASRIDRSRINVIGYGFGKGDIAGHKLDLSTRGLKLEIKTPWGSAQVSNSILGAFNAHNILGVLGVLACADIRLDDAVAAVSELESVPGRMQTIREDGYPLVVIDYAHTPDALEKVLETLRDLLIPGAQLHCVFGCGGDRDAGKRPLMGEIATRLAHHSVITSDNPRSEDPRSIIDQIAAGAHARYRIEPDRAIAIHGAILSAAPDDIVLIAGKGHETHQEIAGHSFRFSDFEVVRALTENRESPGGARV
jgi:UDP-N-acetylmuramoyl-L-alanyl-D-glutamate--2,6-diaminopimelate ligase